MKLIATTLFVNDQQQALDFYTTVLGFVVKEDKPMWEFRRLTVIDAAGASAVEISLEPNENATARAYQEWLYKQNIPAMMFGSSEFDAEVIRLQDAWVGFAGDVMEYGDMRMVTFDDTCGNWLLLVERDW